MEGLNNVCICVSVQHGLYFEETDISYPAETNIYVLYSICSLILGIMYKPTGHSICFGQEIYEKHMEVNY